MTPAPLRLRPVFKERVWAGNQLGPTFGYELPGEHIGECWGVSAREDSSSTVVGGQHDGEDLLDVWRRERAFFGDDARATFPLLVKFLDAGDWLSVQVHPDDDEALRLEGVPLGKTECWYVVAADEGAELIIGHRARDRAELAQMIDEGRWSDLLLRRPVAPGDFVYVPSGTIHAVGPGLLICEVQQNCDTTYRVYDFDRSGLDGRPRALHLDKSKQVSTAPYDPASTDTAGDPEPIGGGSRTRLVRGEHFGVDRHEVDGDDYGFDVTTYQLLTVVRGEGRLRYDGVAENLAAGDHVVLPASAGRVALDGHLTVISSWPTPA